MNYISRGFKQVYLTISHKGLEKIKNITIFYQGTKINI